jgi:hypothetical protein
MEEADKKPQNLIDLDSVAFNYNGVDELKDKLISVGKAAKESAKIMQYNFGETKPVAYEIAEALAKCASRIFGGNGVTMKWHEEWATNTTTIAILVETHYYPKKCQWVFKFTNEYMYQLEKSPSLSDSQNVFMQLLPDMCKRFDDIFHLKFALPVSPKKLWNEKATPIDFSIDMTSSSYEYLSNIKFIDQVINNWNESHDVNWSNYLDEVDLAGYQYKSQYKHQNELDDSGALMQKICPGLRELAKAPCGCSGNYNGTTISRIIMHLNDEVVHNGVNKEWTREEIADWLESLDVDLSLVDNSSTTEKEN